ncbi:sushi, von Willebrand factor type A, EGF and pentraxin domain-containing protein 1-like [Branchiostoma floridae]|uniref:Sushi, von Willebrand factor type A, EGF and pentraxin domain-containing protein 1-like n=2 Tax=Branchiostoma floridae TaxID=7739 RepID=A0A9J7HRR3_BRAFL|nr:sushi, von Willebrand factor type A, EGF and pentraxin domain-containing protein 1-like [Branchiostoma floridae]
MLVMKSTTCPYPVDLIFLLDSSESFRTSGFEDAKTFIQSVVNYFTLGENDTRVGVVTYSNADAQITRVKLNENYTRVELLTEIRNLPYDRGHTFTGLGLDHVRNNSFLEVNGRRNNTPDVLIVLTDDESEDDVILPAQLTRQMGIKVFVVGVGEKSDVSQATLETIAGTPDRVFRLRDHDFLVDDEHPNFIRESILSKPCNPPCHADATCRLLVETYTCKCNAGFVGNGFTCTARQCPALTAPTNGVLSPLGPYSYLNQVTVICNSGYDLDGVTPIRCQDDGTWSNPVGTCRLRCSELTAPTNGARIPSTGANSYRNTITYTCNTGYQLNGASPLTCRADGTWSNPVPTCTRGQTTSRPCQALTAPTNGALSPAAPHSYPVTVTFACNTGYVRNGVQTTTCRADGSWNNPTPTCTPGQCPDLTPPANGALSPPRPYSYLNMVVFTCDTGYVLNGAADTLCQADGSWRVVVSGISYNTSVSITPSPLVAGILGGARRQVGVGEFTIDAATLSSDPDGIISRSADLDYRWSCDPIRK